MSRTINTVAGNTAPPIQLTVKRGSTVIDLTGCTVKLIILKGTTVTNTGHQSATVTTPTLGLITYTRQAGDLTLPGTYKCAVGITYGDATYEEVYDLQTLKARRPSQ